MAYRLENIFMTTENLPSFIQKILLPETYPHSVDEVKLVQTHISFVTLAGDYVYKWKKPVNFGFLDFSTLEKRKHYCEQELLLNKRLCPELYLDVVTMTQEGDVLSLGGGGDVVEYGVRMNRMDEEGMMGNLLESDNISEDHLDRIVKVLTPFYQEADGGESLKEFGKAESVAVNVLENFDQTEGFVGGGALDQDVFDRIKTYAKGFLEKEAVFNGRIEAGKIKDCHGDLYSANICFDQEKTYIFDCIEFNERFRYSDVAADVAFLAMDLDLHGKEDLSDNFIKRFIEESGDNGILDVLNFYKCYRAYVRGKIGLFTASDPAVDSSVAEKCLADARKYFALADRYACA